MAGVQVAVRILNPPDDLTADPRLRTEQTSRSGDRNPAPSRPGAPAGVAGQGRTVAGRPSSAGGPADLTRVVASRSYLSLDQAREALDAQHAGARVSLDTDPTNPDAAQALYWAEVTYPRQVIARVGSRVAHFTTFAQTPQRVAELAGYELRPQDQVRVARDRLGQLRQVKVLKVRRHTRILNRPLAFGTRVVTDLSLGHGQEVLRTPGRNGTLRVKVSWQTVNGRVQDRRSRVLSRRDPVDRIVARGPARPTPSVPRDGYPFVGGGAEEQNWAGLAQCESGGNPRAVNPAGYYGLYQFNTGTWASVGGTGLPSHASAAEQTYRAKLLFASRGAQPWPHCGRYL